MHVAAKVKGDAVGGVGFGQRKTFFDDAADGRGIRLKFARQALPDAGAKRGVELGTVQALRHQLIGPAGGEGRRRHGVGVVGQDDHAGKIQLAAKVVGQRRIDLLDSAGALDGLGEFQQTVDGVGAFFEGLHRGLAADDHARKEGDEGRHGHDRYPDCESFRLNHLVPRAWLRRPPIQSLSSGEKGGGLEN
jgi:hypothetical protein